MASKTTNYGLNKHSPQDFYNVEARNENWDKIDEALAATDPTKITAKAAPADGDGVMIADSADGGKAKRLLWSSVKAALGKLFVPLARKINGKTLAKDVTLTGDDIAMGADDAENLRTAMAKQKMVTSIIEDGGHRILFADGAGNVAAWCDGDTVANATLQATIGKVTLSLHCVITPTGDYGLALNRTMDGVNWNKLADVALCVAPEVHDLPLANGWLTCGTSINWYSKDQFGQVTVCFRLKSTSETDCNGVEIAVLPEGFKPQNGVTVPGLITFANYTRMPCHVDINANGVVQLYADGSIPSDQKVIELTCAEFHYPAG